MSSVTVSILFLLAIWAFYIGFLLFTDFFVKTASYLNVMVINYFWFSASQTVYGYEVYYPDLFGNRWINFSLCSAALLFLTYLMTRLKEIRSAYLITSGALCMLTSFGVIFEKVVLGDFPGTQHVTAEELSGWVEPLFVGIGVLVIVAVLFIVSRRPENDEPGNFYWRFFACIILAPAPFALMGALLLRQSNSTEFSGKQKLLCWIVTLITVLAYYLYDSISDNRRLQLEQENDRKEVLKAQRRSEISTAVRKQMDKIDNSMGYLRNNVKFLKETTRSNVSALYREAKQIDKAYQGTADGEVLKRLSEIRIELERIRTALSEEMRRASRRSSENSEKNRNAANNSAGDGDRWRSSESGESSENGKSSSADNEGNKASGSSEGQHLEEVQEQSVISAFFNGCANDDEIRKRYHQLCKVFHPDAGNGDEETFVLIKEEYDRLIKK